MAPINNPSSIKQRKMFFALVNHLGYDNEEMKERAKQKFGLTSFKDATKEQMNWFIDKLLEKVQEK